jgi:nitroreductase
MNDALSPSAAAALGQLLSRRSVSPRRLRLPAPDEREFDLLLQAALRAPDHGGLHPWRVVEFRASEREALADRFEREKLRRDPLASASDRAKAREHATRPPMLLGFVVSPRARTQVPVREQELAAGAALANLLNAAHALGFGAGILSGERCFDVELLRELGLGPEEWLAGFVSIGTVHEAPPAAEQAPTASVRSCWTPAAASSTPPATAAEPGSGKRV